MSDQNRALYSCIDGAVTYKVWSVVEQELHTPILKRDVPLSYEHCYNQTMALYEPTIFMATYGLRLNTDKLEVEKNRVRRRIDELQERLDEMTGGVLNPNSPKSCQRYFYIEKGIPPYRSDSGAMTTDDTALSRIARKGYKEASICQEIRGLIKLASTYLDVKSDPDGRIRCSWNLRGTKEGRLSSSQNIFLTGLNFQNLHPQFKSFIEADPGHLFIEIDKKQAEWVVVAYLSGDGRMIKVIEEKIDPHIFTAGLITGAPLELLEHEEEIIGHHTDPDTIFQLRMEYCKELTEMFLQDRVFLPRSMSCRQAGKKANHALNYREGYRNFALWNEIPESEAKGIVEGYRAGYCNLPNVWWPNTESELRRTRVLDNCFGRIRRFLGAMDDKLVRAAIAFRPQSTVVDLVNQGMIKAYYDPSYFMFPMALGAQIHDSVLFQYPVAQWPDLALCIKRFAEHLNPTMEYGGREFRIESEISIGLNWGIYGKENEGGMMKVPLSTNPDKLAKDLEAAYAKLRN